MIHRIRGYFGGIGDQLQFSCLPHELSLIGHSVYLLNDPHNTQVHPFRNEEIKEFVWGNNPWLKGEITGRWTAGDLPDTYRNVSGNFLKNWSIAHGLKGENSLPIIYHKPNIINGIDAVIELSGITLKYEPQKVKSLVKQIIDAHPGYKFMQIVSEYQHNRIIITNNAEHHEIKSLFELWDILNSCKMFISLNSGTHSIAAAALRNNKTMVNFCILPDYDYGWIMEHRKFVYNGCAYLKEGNSF